MGVPSFKRTKFACYSAYFTMSSIFSLPPLLFVIFHDTYGISYTLLGTLVLVNFCTQLLVDIIFTFFANRFNIHNFCTQIKFSLVKKFTIKRANTVHAVFVFYAYDNIQTA